MSLPAYWLVGEVCYEFVGDPHIDGEEEKARGPQPDKRIDAFELEVERREQPQTLHETHRSLEHTLVIITYTGHWVKNTVL